MTRYTPFVTPLATDGLGGGIGGTVDLAGDYTTPDEFFIGAAALPPFRVARIIVYIEDTGTIDADGWGNAAALTNGLEFTLRSAADAELYNLTPTPITQNGHWSRYCFDTVVKSWGTGNEYLAARWSFNKFSPDGLVVEPGEKFSVTAQDNMSTLVSFTLMCQGWYDSWL